jgi:glycosyltransferase involved in cell wall biosynthesis
VLLSVVVPAYNEAEVLPTTHRRLIDALGGLEGVDLEILYVDDGSKDGTREVLQGLQRQDPRVRVIRFSRNFGHQMAVTAGVEHASGDAVVLIDADLQDPPELIPEMLKRWREGYGVAYGVRAVREGESTFKRWTAMAFYRVLNRLTDTAIPLDTGDFRLMDRRVVNALRNMPERDRFVRGMVSWVGFRQVGVPYPRAARLAGESKYPLFKMVRFAIDGIASFSVRPLRLATWMGLLSAFVALCGIIYAILVRALSHHWVAGWAATFVAILFVGGIQLVSVGVIGEYVGRIYGEVKRRPLYVVDERSGFDSPRVDRPPADGGVNTRR